MLTNAALDPVGKIPEFKYCAVRISLFGQRADCFAEFRGQVGERETDFATRDVPNPPPRMPEFGHSCEPLGNKITVPGSDQDPTATFVFDCGRRLDAKHRAGYQLRRVQQGDKDIAKRRYGAVLNERKTK